MSNVDIYKIDNLNLKICEDKLKKMGLNDDQVIDLKNKLTLIAQKVVDTYLGKQIKNKMDL